MMNLNPSQYARVFGRAPSHEQRTVYRGVPLETGSLDAMVAGAVELIDRDYIGVMIVIDGGTLHPADIRQLAVRPDLLKRGSWSKPRAGPHRVEALVELVELQRQMHNEREMIDGTQDRGSGEGLPGCRSPAAQQRPAEQQWQLALDLNTFIITRNQKEMASDIAFLADGHARMAASRAKCTIC